MPGRNVGALVASETGRTTGYALMGLEQRGRFFIGPGVDVYEGMIVGRANDEYDVALNVVREKKLTNMRAAGSDENVKLAAAGGVVARARDRVHRRRRARRGDAAVDSPAQTDPQRNRASAAAQTRGREALGHTSTSSV